MAVRTPSKSYMKEIAKIDYEYAQRNKERIREMYLSQEPVYEILFDDGKRYWIDEKGNEQITELSFASLWGGKEHFTKEEIESINPEYLKFAKRYLG